MKNLLTLILISISVACFGQVQEDLQANLKNSKLGDSRKSVTVAGSNEQSRQLVPFDSILVLPMWHQQQIAAFDTEIKRLGGTTIEAEQQRIANEKQILINSFIVGKIPDASRIERMNPPSEGKIILILKPKK